MEVEDKRSLVNQFLSNSSGESKHSKTSVLKLLQFVLGKLLLCLLGVKSDFKDLGISTSSWLSLKKTDGLETGNNCKSQSSPERVGVDCLKCSSGGGKEVISVSSLSGVLLWDKKSDDSQLGKSAVHDLNLTVTDELLWGSLGGETSGVEEANRREVSIKASGVDISSGCSVRDVLLLGSIGNGAGGRKIACALGNRSRGEGGGAGEEGGDNSELHGDSVKELININSEEQKNGLAALVVVGEVLDLLQLRHCPLCGDLANQAWLQLDLRNEGKSPKKDVSPLKKDRLPEGDERK